MSRQSAARSLTLPEELERLEQQITLTLQEIDSNFSRAHTILTTSILPIVEQYAKHSGDVWEGSRFWKSFFEASANVSLSGYEEAALEDDTTQTDTPDTTATLEPPDDHVAHTTSGANAHHEEDDEFSVDSPTQVTGLQTTPKLSGSTTRRTNGANKAGPSKAATFRSPSPRKYTGRNPLATADASEEPSTPRPHTHVNPQSSPFEPESAFQPSASNQNNDPLMHRVLDKNYRIQATPHTQRRQQRATTTKQTPATATKTRHMPWADSPESSPAVAPPQLRSDLFLHAKGPRTPGVSVLTPARGKAGRPAPTTSTGRQLFSPEDKTYSATKTRASHIFDDDSEEDDLADMSPPKTMQFHVPQSRLMQTPAREASRKIVEDLLLTAGADNTDDIEGIGEGLEEASPSVVRRAFDPDDDTF